MASDFFLEAMQSLPDSLFAPSPFDLLSTTTDQSGVHPAMMASASRSSKSSESRRTRPHPTQAIKCPRCDSQNTKFCYYNNYNLSQPRHFCKACRRYWTNGGVLRNVPIGGGCRKNKKSTSSSSSSASAKQASQKSPESSVTLGNLQNSSSSSPSSSSSSSVLPDPPDFRCIAELNEIMRFSTGIDCSNTVPPLNTSDFSSMLSSSTTPYNLSHTDQIQIQNHGDLSMLGAFSSGLGGVPEFPWKFHKQRESFLNYSTQQQVPPALENLQNYASVSGSSNTVGETSPAEQSHAGGNYSFEALFDEWSRWNDDSSDRPHHWSLPQQESCVYLP